MVAITGTIQELTAEGVTAESGSITISLKVPTIDEPITSTAPFTVNSVGGAFSFVLPESPAGSGYKFRFSGIPGLGVFYFAVPGTAVTLSELIDDHQVDPTSFDAVTTAPTILAEIDRLDAQDVALGVRIDDIPAGIALGETSSTAYRGDRGKTAYDHSQASGNPHSTTAAQVGADAAGTAAALVGALTKSSVDLGNVDNTSDANKPVSTATQAALDLKEARARAPYLGPVGSRSSISNGTISTNTVRQVMTWDAQRATDNISAAALVYSSIAGTGEASANATATVKASIEYPVGTITQITFGASASGALGAAGLLQSDLVTLPVTIPTGARFWVGTHVAWAAGLTAPRPKGMIPAAYRAGARVSVNSSNSSVTDTTLTGVRTDGGYNAQDDGFTPVAVLGMTTRPTFFLAGDSTTNAQDLRSAEDSEGLKGLGEQIVGLRYGFINAALNSDTYALANSAYTNRLALSQYCSHVIDLYGVNDAYANNAATQLAAFTTFRGKFPTTKPYYKTTIVPKVTGAWNLADGSDQTPATGFANMLAFNDLIRYGLNGLIDGCIDLEEITSLGRGTAKIRPAEKVVTDAAMTSGSNILTSATAKFGSDLGKYVGVAGAGSAGALLVAQIIGVTNATTVTLGLRGNFGDNVSNASTTVSGAVCGIGVRSLDGTHQVPAREKDIRLSLLPVTAIAGVR